MYVDFFKKIVLIVLLNNVIIFADVGLQEGVYNAAEEMIAFDEEMTRLIEEHNQIDMDEEENRIEDFEETEKGYILKTNIDGNNTTVDVILKDRMITISIVQREKEMIQVGAETSYESTISSSATALFLPADADDKTMQKIYQNGILEVTFLKK